MKSGSITLAIAAVVGGLLAWDSGIGGIIIGSVIIAGVVWWVVHFHMYED